MSWDGHERRLVSRGECCGEWQARVSSLEAYRHTQERDIERLIRVHEQTNTRLEVINDNLARAVNQITAIKTTQRMTHVFAGTFGAFFGGLVELIAKHLFGHG